ncbi:HNH endonuclease signature motif containing protein [Parafrigoribacterium mesophilum]|uniref:HNH endonuclease signature motif containing protein n=1 Tax=Parafrigoribacterium mesophilum TaxID=433646 RepID=UPI0031FBA70A
MEIIGPSDDGGDSPTPDGPLTPAGIMVDTLSNLVEASERANRVVAAAMAMRAQLVDQARMFSELTAAADSNTDPTHREMLHRSFRAELGAALRMPERSIEALLNESESLVHELPATLVALRDGAISYRHAQIMVSQTTTLEPEAISELETKSLRFAATLTASKFDRKVREMRERLHPESISERHTKALGDRAVEFAGDRDGMAWLNVLLTAPDAVAVYTRLTNIAVSLQGPNEDRSLSQLRADVFRDLLLDDDPEILAALAALETAAEGADPSAAQPTAAKPTAVEPDGDESRDDVAPRKMGARARYRGIAPTVFVTVPALTLLGRSDEPATLEGYGPIDTETATELAARAPSFIRLLTHPETGVVLSMGRQRYRVPKDLRLWLQLRDGTCRFPGCNCAAGRCDLDHTLDWFFGGMTDYDNLADLCGSHHSVKHKTAWTLEQVRDATGASTGDLVWTSPAGRRYITEPNLTMRPAPGIGTGPPAEGPVLPQSEPPHSEPPSGDLAPGDPAPGDPPPPEDLPPF